MPQKNTPSPYPVFALQDLPSGQEDRAYKREGRGKRKCKFGRWRRRKRGKGKGSSNYAEEDYYTEGPEEYFDPLDSGRGRAAKIGADAVTGNLVATDHDGIGYEWIPDEV